MEKFIGQEYRNNLAKELRETRKNEPEKARDILDEERKTENYKQAEEEHFEKKEKITSDEDRQKREIPKQKVEVKYTEPDFYNDGNGSLEIEIGKNVQKIDLRNVKFNKKDINKIKIFVDGAKNDEEVYEIIDKIKTAVDKTEFGQVLLKL